MQDRKGKQAALAIYCAAKQGLITETDYNSVADRFGDIGSRSGYNRYMGNPSLFTQLEIESTTNLFAKPNEQNDACIKSAMARKGGCEETNVFVKPDEQNDACIKSAMARKGGCEETNFIQSLINPKGEQSDDAE